MNDLLKHLQALFYPSGMQCLCCRFASGGALLCPACQLELEALRLPAEPRWTGSVWRYDGCARALVIGLKYSNTADCAAVLAEGMAQSVRAMHLPQDTVLTWVTMPEQRLRERGIDHGRLLCEALSERTGFPVRPLLSRTAHVHTQRGLNRAERLRNLSDTICCDEAVHGPVLLVDDVLTTGATAETCRRVLLDAGASQVYVLTATMALIKQTEHERG